MFTNNEETKTPVGAVSTAMTGLERLAAKAAPTALVALAALLLAPGTALADNECDPVLVDPSANGAIADSYTCDQAEYDDGVTYDADGDLTVTFTPNISEIGENNGAGIGLTGDGVENITFDSATNNSEIESRNTVGPLLDVSTVDGDILISTEEMDADGQNPAGVTHAIRAIASGAGNVDITTTGNVEADGFSNPADSIGIEAQAQGGGDITVTTEGNARGNQYGIYAETAGAGDLTLDLTGGFQSQITGDEAGVYAVTGGGLLTINVEDDTRISSSSSGAAIRTEAGGDAIINFSGRGSIEFLLADMTAAAGTTTTLNINNNVGNDNIAPENLLVLGAGAGDFEINNVGGLHGGIDFSATTGDVTFNNFGPADQEHLNAGWSMGNNTSVFGGGDDTINNFAGGLISTAAPASGNPGDDPEFIETTIDFGPGDDVFNNAGALLVSESRFSIAFPPTGGGDPINIEKWKIASEVNLSNLETFDNSGLIVMGGYVTDANQFTEPEPVPRTLLATDFVDCTPFHQLPPFGPTSCLAFTRINDSDWRWNDVLAMPGTDFVGSGDSAILLDAALHLGRPQSNCYDNRAGVEGFFNLPGADCIDLTGGSTAGSTEIIVRDRQDGDQSAYNPEGMVVVDVSGGTSAAGHFTLSPESDRYNARYDAVDKGLFMHVLAYDEANQQHKLVGIPSQAAMHMPLLVQAAQEVSRHATTAWRDRRTHARGLQEDGMEYGGDVWAHVSQTQGERDTRQSISTGYGERIDFGGANDFDQDTLTVTLGRSLFSGGGADSVWMVGGTLGYSRAKLEFDAAPAGRKADLEGATIGIYGNFDIANWFLDAAVNYGKLSLDDEDPSLTLFPNEGKIVGFYGSGGFINALQNREVDPPHTEAYTLGAYAEGGMRFDVGDLLQVEPLAALSFAGADFDGMNVPSNNPERPGNEVFGNGSQNSLRGGLGARLRADSTVGNLLFRYSLTGRFWEELGDETEVRIASEGPDAIITDEFDGSFMDVRAGVSLSDLTGSVSGYLNLDALSGDDYDSLGVSAGFRYQW